MDALLAEESAAPMRARDAATIRLPRTVRSARAVDRRRAAVHSRSGGRDDHAAALGAEAAALETCLSRS